MHIPYVVVALVALLATAASSGCAWLLLRWRRSQAAEAARRAAEQSAQQALAAIVESSYDAIIGKTLDGRITSWNAGAEALFGYRADEAVGQPVQMLIPPDRAGEEMRILASLADGRRVPAFETLRRAKDGTLREVSVTISPVRDATGRVVGGAKIARDIAPQRRAEAARLEALRLLAENRQMHEASRMKSRFLANMSHELRTPLNAVIGFADLLASGRVPPGSEQHQRFLGHIGSSGRHLLQLINDVLDLTKAEAGRFDFRPEPVALPPLVDEVLGVLQPQLLAKGLTAEVALAPGLDDLLLDPGRLRQALFNYLSNAIKFTPAGGRIALRGLPEGPDHFRVEVEDTGIGIAAADLPGLFTEFHQLDSGYDKHHAGTGLGLALTRLLVRAQGGSVGVRSAPGVGSVFHLVLPRRVAVASASLADLPGHLLVVEHDDRVRAELVQGLGERGFRADAVANAAQALDQASRCGYDGITLDLMLPDQRGLGLLAGIRAGPHASRGTPVLGMALVAEPGRAAMFAVADVLAKPIDGAAVLAALRRAGLLWPPGQRMLVIDDDPQALALMQATLDGAGVQAVGLPDGARALARLDELRPAAIVLDLMMPGMDGFAVLDALHRLPAWRETPVFVWTSLALSDDDCLRLAQSARAIIAKGGGATQALLDRLRGWRPVAAGG